MSLLNKCDGSAISIPAIHKKFCGPGAWGHFEAAKFTALRSKLHSIGHPEPGVSDCGLCRPIPLPICCALPFLGLGGRYEDKNLGFWNSPAFIIQNLFLALHAGAVPGGPLFSKRGQQFSKLVRSALSVLTGRQVVFLPHISRSEDLVLTVRAAYRIESGRLAIDVGDPGCGELQAFVLGFEGHFPTHELWRSTRHAYRGPIQLQFDLASGAVEYGGIPWGRIPVPIRGRRFNIRLCLTSDSGTKSRETGHYFPGESGPANQWYFHGNNYVDHELQSRFEGAQVLRLLEQQVVKGPVLEVGCATGAMLHELRAAGYDSVGVDISAWAVEQANNLMGEEVAWLWNAEDEIPPPPIVARQPYGALILWAVMEHFKDPFTTLAKLTALTQPGSLLLINTSNSDSMLHWLFGREWEGYFDATHYGVDQVGVQRLRQQLPALGWQIEMLQTFLVWDSNSDPIHASLREWYSYDARLRCLLKERDLGDMIHCVAKRCVADRQ